MRIPTKNLYRAFPELDRYSDEQCRLFVRRLRNKPAYVVAVVVGTVVAFFISLALTCMGSGVLFALLDASAWWRPQIDRALGRGAADTLLPVGCIVLAVAVPALITLGTRDFLYRRFLRRAIRMEIARIRCLRCSYSLLGQVVTDGSVRCPECGRPATLGELGLESADDLMPDGAAPAARSGR